MTDSSKDPLGDPFDLLRAHVRAVALLEQPAVDADELVADITGSIDRADRSRGAQVLPLHGFPSARSPRRRRWFVAGSVATIVAVGGAGVAAYVALRPSDPTFGILCRESAASGSSSVQLALDDDPIAACANVWKTGDLPVSGGEISTGEVPDLIACTGGQGAIDVLPVSEEGSCEAFGLAEFKPAGIVEDAVVQLQRALANTSGTCRSEPELARLVSSEFDRLGLTDWQQQSASSSARCVAASIDAPARLVVIVPDPFATPSPEETP